MERNVPKLRFKGFNDEWKEKKLSEIANIVGGGTPSTTEKSYWDGNIQWFTPTEIKDAKYVASSMRTITEQGVKNSSAKILPKGSILLTTRATLGEMAILENDATTNQGFQSLIVNKNNNNEFVYYLQEKIKKYCYKNASGSTFLEISKSNLEKFKVNMPSLQEQERIANFLTKVDKIIEKQDEKVKNLEKYKKGMMQKIFSQEIRFKDENGKEYPEWQEYKLNELCNFFSGGTPLTSKKEYYDGNIPFIRSAEISSENTELTISEIGLNNSSAKMIQKGDLLYALYGATSGEVSISKLNGAINQAILCIRSNRCNLIFLEKVLRNSKQNIIKTYLQGGQGNLSANIIKELQYNFPCLDEQDKIAKFITKIDIILQKEIDKLNELYKWKKGLLQQMFV